MKANHLDKSPARRAKKTVRRPSESTEMNDSARYGRCQATEVNRMETTACTTLFAQAPNKLYECEKPPCGKCKWTFSLEFTREYMQRWFLISSSFQYNFVVEKDRKEVYEEFHIEIVGINGKMPSKMLQNLTSYGARDTQSWVGNNESIHVASDSWRKTGI